LLLAVAVTLPLPLPLSVTLVADRTALAPEEGAVNLTTPPATGSPALLETVTVRAEAKGVLTTVLWLLPAETVTVKPWLSKAPMSTVPWTMRGRPRWSVVAPPSRALEPASNAGLPGNRARVLVGPP